MKRIKIIAGALALLGALWIANPMIHSLRHLCPVRPTVGIHEAGAMPQFARRYGVSCTMCHTTVPALTKVGYQFRRAGFRMPDEIGNEAKFNGLKDMYAVRIRQQYGLTAAATDKNSNYTQPSHHFVFNELTFYPITGAIGKYWSTMAEITFMPDEKPELENAYVRATYPINPDLFLTARAGIFHPYEGYGASDRMLSNNRLLFVGNAANNAGFDTQVKLSGQDQQGLELGATYEDTTLSLALLNGRDTSLGSSNGATSDNKSPDILLFFNQFIGDKAAVSSEYLNGKSMFAFSGAAGNEWLNKYQRLSLFGTYNALSDYKADLLAGWELGQDQMLPVINPDGTAKSPGTFNSTGWFLGVNSKLHEHLSAFARYDTFNPSTRTTSDRLSAITLGAVAPFEWVKFMLDYQLKRTQNPSPGRDVTSNTLKAEWMIIF